MRELKEKTGELESAKQATDEAAEAGAVEVAEAKGALEAKEKEVRGLMLVLLPVCWFPFLRMLDRCCHGARALREHRRWSTPQTKRLLSRLIVALLFFFFRLLRKAFSHHNPTINPTHPANEQKT